MILPTLTTFIGLKIGKKIFNGKKETQKSKPNTNKENEKKKDDSIVNSQKNYSEMKHLKGLINIASTCYMNSILQCFSNIKELAEYFQSDKMKQLVIDNQFNNNKLFPLFQEVINNLWSKNGDPFYAPNNFKQRLGEMNPLFQGAYPNDAKDLLTFILMQLHEELNIPKNNNNIINNIPNVNMQENKQLMFQLFSNDFINNYRSIISELFFGLFYTETKCYFNHTFYNYQTFNFLIFPLEKVLELKMRSNNCFSNNNTVTLDDCFKHYEYPIFLNDYYCNKCRNQVNCTYTSKLSVLPNIIIIILNRGKGLQYKVNISFENENLNLGKYVEYGNDESIYELIGLVTHYGDSSANGHFMARCKSPIDREWYLYNDAMVEKIGFFNNESFAQGNPYILFYKKINFQKD